MDIIEISYISDYNTPLPPGVAKILTNVYGNCVIKSLKIDIINNKYDKLKGYYGKMEDIKYYINKLYGYSGIIVKGDKLIKNNTIIGIIIYDLYELTVLNDV